MEASREMRELFRRLAWLLSWWYIPDNSAMSLGCLSGVGCEHIPVSVIASWQWKYVGGSERPALQQFDGDASGGKMRVLERQGFHFRSYRQGQKLEAAC